MPDERGDQRDELADAEPRDELPQDLDVTAWVGPYTFPDIVRRRIPGVIYLVLGGAGIVLWATRIEATPLVSPGLLVGGIGLVLFGLYCFAAGWRLQVREIDALVEATKAVGFPIGHASAQLGWRGLRSRPTWRILLYSADEPPAQRGMVLVDGVDGQVLDKIVEANPEDWSELSG